MAAIIPINRVAALDHDEGITAPEPEPVGRERVDQAAATLVATVLVDFVDWLYEDGPVPDEMPREKLTELYLKARGW